MINKKIMEITVIPISQKSPLDLLMIQDLIYRKVKIKNDHKNHDITIF